MKLNYFKKVVKCFLCILLLLVFYSCDKTEYQQFKEMTSPIVLAGVSKDGDILLIDARGFKVVLHRDYYISKIISNSYNLNDTISYTNFKTNQQWK